MSVDEDDGFVEVGSVEEAKAASPTVVTIDGSAIGLFYHEDEFYATDLRCPHMGFPLTDGTVDAGILTCPWHHARFELSCGDTLDPFADDVPTYPVEVRDEQVFVSPQPIREVNPEDHWYARLEHGLRENIGLIIAKSVIGLSDETVSHTVPLDIGVKFGTSYRENGWSSGLTTLGVMANLVAHVREDDRSRALYVGLSAVANDCAGEPPFFVQDPLSNTTVSPERLKGWFRDNIEVRDADGAERVLRAAIRADLPEEAIAEMLVAAATDHLYLDTGHRLDFINKAFEMLDHLGWDRADAVLPSLVPGLAMAERAEENASWRQPVDIASLCFDAADRLPELVEAGSDRTWSEPDDLVDVLLGDDPHAIMDTLTDAIAAGAEATDLAQTVTYTGAIRVAQFGTSNEFFDWNTVHHTYTYANGVYGLAQRTDALEVYRGVFDAAMNVYLDRFLNVPPQHLPDPQGDRDPASILDELDSTFEIEASEEVNRAGRLTAEYLESGGEPEILIQLLGKVLLREDVGFHPRQNLEVAIRQYHDTHDDARGNVHLIAAARYLAAHTPTRRSGEQTYSIAERLNRGEKIHE